LVIVWKALTWSKTLIKLLTDRLALPAVILSPSRHSERSQEFSLLKVESAKNPLHTPGGRLPIQRRPGFVGTLQNDIAKRVPIKYIDIE
jgi:hypothetical protein